MSRIRWVRWGGAAAAAVGIYGVLGVVVAPWAIERQLPRWAASALERQASVGAVRFNPFTLRLQMDKLLLAQAQGDPLFAVDKLDVQLQWRSVVRRAWSFDHVRLTAPEAHLVIAPDGSFNLNELIATLARKSPPEEKREKAALPRVSIGQLALERGTLRFQDRRAGYENVLAPIDFTLSQFSTLPGPDESLRVSARSAHGGRLLWKGTLADPLRGSGEITLEDVALPQLAVYLKPYLQGDLEAGRLSASLPYRFSYEGGRWDAALTDARLALQELVLAGEGARLSADALRLQLTLQAQAGGPDLQLRLQEASGSASGLALARGGAVPVRLAEVGFEGGDLDLASQRVALARVHARGGAFDIKRDPQGRIDLLETLPRAKAKPAESEPTRPAAPWHATVARIDVEDFSADIDDQATGLKLRVSEAQARLSDAGTDLGRPVKFDASLRVDAGGRIAAQGELVPQRGVVQADVRVDQLALSPVQPLLGRYLKLRLAQGTLSAQGRLTTGAGTTASPSLRYLGSLQVAGLALQEQDGTVFAAWNRVAAERVNASVGPDRVDVPELRVEGLKAQLMIENDRSFNAARLLVQQAPAQAAQASPAAEGAGFPLRIRRLRVQDAKLDFADLSLRPQFAAKIHELNGVVTGISNDASSRSRIELDGRVDEFGTVRARGDLNLFSPTQDTDVNLVFRNVDMVPASPYTTKFAGYHVAEGKISLDLQYKLRERRLLGENLVVIDRLTLGERVDSPDALKLPLQLAIAILKDKDGRIELGLPVSGDLSDPQFSYGALVWKALGNLLSKVVTAPIRALGSALGVDADHAQAIEFDAGSARLLPPEREKLRMVADMLSRRPQLALTVPAQFGEAADAAALKAHALRLALARQAGTRLAEGEEPGPPDLADGEVRSALREMYAARFGAADLDKQRRAAENATPAGAQGASAKTAKDAVPLWRRVGKLMQGEPQVADAGAFYEALLRRLAETQPLAADALPSLGSQRAQAIVQALKEAGVDAGRLRAGAPAKVEAQAQGPVPLGLALEVR